MESRTNIRNVALIVPQAGKLASLIPDTEKYNLISLKLIGNLNGTDINYIREMAGRDKAGKFTTGKLTKLDLSEAHIIKGGRYTEDGYTSTAKTIGPYMFRKCQFTSIILPEDITDIEHNAFEGCHLKRIIIPDSVIRIGKEAFANCLHLEDITIGSNTLFFDYNAFLGCSNLINFNVSIQNKMYSALNGVLCNKNISILICFPQGRIGSYAIPSSITDIWNNAFQSCDKLTEIIIPKSVTNIEEDAFCGCSNLKRFKVSNENEVYSDNDGVLYSKNKTKLIYFPKAKPNNNYTIPEQVTHIGTKAFQGCLHLTNIDIGDKIKCIDKEAFHNCSGLEKVIIGNQMIQIGEGAFEGCTHLSQIIWESNLHEISERTFKDCYSLEYIDIPESVTCIGDFAFEGCIHLKHVRLSNHIKYLGNGIFSHCSDLVNIYIPDSVEQIGASAFVNCTCLEDIRIGHNIPNIGSYAFWGCHNLSKIENI